MTVSEGNNINNINQNEDVFVFPASYGQKRMWFLDQFEPGSPYYNIPVAFKITGRFEQEIFVKTINKIVSRHESIRTTFTNIKGQPFQVISPELKIDIPVIDLSEKKNTSVDDEVKKIAVKEARAPFDLSKGPLFRVKIVKLSEIENVVLITMHHIISDGWSMGILVGEITSIYISLLNGKDINLPDLEIQYADFSEWQNEYLSGDVLENQLNYWKNKLGDSNSLLELPTDRNRQAVWTNNGSSIERYISSEIIDGLQKLGNSQNATLFMTLVAAFNILLSRYSGQDDINIGTPIANRTDKEIEKIIGLFINTLVLRTDLSGDPTFTELLSRVRKTNLEAFEHQDLPFEMLVDAIQPERNMSYAPLFQVMIILQNNPIKTSKLSDIEVSMISVDMGTSTSDLTFSFSTGKNGASCSIEYNTDLFNESTIVRMFNDFNTLLKEIVTNPNKRISRYKIIDDETKNKILYEWNSRTIKFPHVNGIHSLFEKWAEKTPNEIAVVDNVGRISYKELNEKSNQLAHYLIKNNKNKNLPIGISLDKSINLLVTVLGVLKSGLSYLPLDPTYPEERLNYMLEDSGIELLITDKNNSEIFSSFSKKKIIIDDLIELNQFDKNNPNIIINENDLAYIIYTSGSTGKAKGTMVQHNSLINIYLGWEQDYKLLNTARNHLQMASFSFDVFGGDWTRALCSGGKLVLIAREQLLEAEQLYEIIIKENIDIAEFVPAVLRNLIAYIDDKSLRLDTFKVLIAGSDIWYVKEYNEFKKYCSPETRLINSFGLTEATIDSTFFEDNNLTLSEERLVPIGKPFPNIKIYILDNNLNIVPIGVKGELYIGGISLARGYYKRPHLTAERFLPNLYSDKPGDRLYKTGDVARYLHDGNIEFLGRADHQIKLRGFRIELGEIENALSEHNAVKDAIVIVREDTEGDKRLVAYLISENDNSIDSNNLREFVSERVPDYMVPSAFVVLKEFPLTPNGKVDRKSLPAPDQKEIQKSFETDYIAPRNETEEIITGIWSEILNLDKVGVFHNFFILGGHSLLATQVISRIKSELKVDVPLRFIFEKPTVEAIANEVQRIKLTSGEFTAPKILPRESSIDIPLSFAQERLWFLDQLEPNSPFYNIPESYRIKGKIDLSILEKCFNKIVERHEILRTNFISNDGTPYQIVNDSLKIKIPVIDLSSKNEKEREKETQEIIWKESKTPISIEELPLFRIKIIKIEDNEHIFVMTIHHIISDDWSTKVIVRELGIFYESYLNDFVPPVPDLSIQYADFSIWQREWLKGKVLDSHINYWKNQLSGLPSLLELPTDFPRPKLQTYNGDFISFELSSELSKKINQVSKEEGVTVFMTLLAAFKILLYKLSGQIDICIGTPSANRNKEEIEPLVGFFVNTLAIRTDCSSNPSFKEFIERIKESTLGAYAHQDLPFEYIVDTVNPERNLSHSPIFQVMFVYQNVQGTNEKRDSDLIIEPIESHSKTSKFDLTLFMVESNNSIGGAFEFNTDLFSKNTIKNFAEYFNHILENALENITNPIESISLLDIKEQEKIVTQLNTVEKMPLIKNYLPVEFTSIANKKYNNTAVEQNDEKYSFGKLEEDSNKLANYLKKLGITNEQIVGVCLPRTFRLITTLLGILKTGAAYLPIDPKYPQDRINYILKDSGTNFVLTENTFLDLFENSEINIVSLDKTLEEINNESSEPPKVNIDKNNICYVIYTSGSTGKPKGTLITHEGLLNYLSWTHHAYPFKQGNGSLVHSTISFDATITSIFPSLLYGKKIVLMKESEELDELAKTINANEKFSIVKITPAHLELLSNLIDTKKAKEISDAMIIGGENLTVSQIQYWQKNAPETLLFNEYGPTETVVGCVVYESSKFNGIGSVPIGRIIPNMKVFVLDKELSQVPNGIIGELYLGGVSLARGYLNKPDLTAERFIPNPFSNAGGERIYKTGDLVKILDDGNLLFIGRVDDQVKVRGYRIELGEIEHKLNSINSITECVVDIKEFGENDKRIIAYIIQGENKKNVKEIINLLIQELPDYMLPSNIVEINKIPLTINGKVDRKKLPLPSVDIRNNEIEFVEPGTDTEKKIYAIWSEILKNNNISVYDNFFDLGGHSLLVTKLVVRIEQQFNISLPIRDIFEFPTIAQLALEIDNGKYFTQYSKLAPIKQYHDKDNIPLSFTQRRLWFLDKLDPGQSIYNMPMAVKINGKVDIIILEQTIDYLAERHETLRTNFTERNGIPQQIISAKHNIEIKVNDFRKLNDDEQKIKVDNIKQNEAIKPFNLEDDPLLRVQIAILSDEQFVIFFTMHHIISDGWSINILLDEFIQSYLAFSNKIEPNLPELKIQYSDYSIWQQENIVGEVLDNQTNYWIKKLENQPALLELPIDKPRPPIKTFNGSHLSFEIDKSTVLKINAMLKSLAITPFMFLLGTFQILLSKLSGQTDISVGTTVANRTRIETEKIIGFFANTLVMRNQVKGTQLIQEFFDQVKKTALESYSNQDVPFEKLVEILKPERDLSNTPLFQVMFVLQNNEQSKGIESDVLVEPLESESNSTQYDLTLSMNASNDNWGGTLEFNTDLFESNTVQAIISSYNHLLNEIVDNNNKFLFELEYLSEEEKSFLFRISEGKVIEYPYPNVLDKFNVIVQKYPSKVACEFDNIHLSYKELDERSDRICSYLILQGFHLEDIIGVMLPNSIELIEWIIGIMKAGCVYMPIDRKYPKDRIEYMIADSGVKAIVTNEVSKITEVNKIKNISLENISKELENHNSIFEKRIIDSENIAYLIYTSGSTGKPKGVMLKHKGLINLVENQIKDFEVISTSRVLQFASISFDASVSEIFMSLLSGATLCLVDRDKLTNTNEIENILTDQNISVVTLPPSLLQVMQVHEFNNLKTIISAGEKLNKEVANKWKQNRNLVNAYGPTEATVGVSSFKFDKIKDYWNSIPIGSSLNNINLFILDQDLKLVQRGTIGEIFIGGISLARGYIAKPDLTADKFIPNPFSDREGERLYRTGDLGRFTKEGVIEYIGRVDEQVKVRGFRIELTEIEIVIKSLSDVEEAVVITQGKENKAKLIAFVKMAEEHNFNYEKIKQKLKDTLPDYMVPGIILEIKEIPFTPNGKIDRKKLQKFEKLENVSSKEYVIPSTEYEVKLASIWQELLDIDKIGIYDNFFELGGHSLLITQLVSRINDKFNVNIHLKDLFEYANIKSQASYIELKEKTGYRNRIKILKSERPEHIPLSFSQQRLWVLDKIETEHAVYNIPTSLRLLGEININNIEKSLKLLVERHESLRTNFYDIDNIPYQIIRNLSDKEFHINYKDLSNLNEENIQKEVATILQNESTYVFDLENDKLFRFTLIKINQNEHIISFTFHHIITDGWSINLLLKEFIEIYYALENNIDLDLPELKLQYADFSIWQREYLEGEILDKQISYWKEKLKGIPPILELPIDKPRPKIKTFNGSKVQINLASVIKDSINQISTKESVTLFMVLLGIFKILLSKYSGQKDICIGTPIANRTEIETERITGFFANTLVLRTLLNGDPTFNELLNRIKNTSLEAYSNQDVPFEKLVELIQPERDLGHSPLFQVMFVLQNNPTPKSSIGTLKIEPVENHFNLTQYDLTLSAEENNSGLTLWLEYNTDLFERSSIELMLERYVGLLNKVLTNPGERISQLSFVENPKEIKLLEQNFKGRHTKYRENNVIELFEKIANQKRDKIAVVDKYSEITYSQLNRKANQIANYLKSLQVNQEEVIAVMMSKRIEMIAAILGILKSGCTYLPIDPTYPEERKKYMLKNSGVNKLLTDNPNLKIDKITVITINDGIFKTNNSNSISSNVNIHEDNLAYLIYTSGSTGQPKGVMLTHKGLLNLVKNQIRDFHVTENSRILQFASLSFDASISEIFMAILSGAILYLENNEKLRDKKELLKIINKNRITTITLPPSLLSILKKEDLKTVETIISAGEILANDIADKWIEDKRLLNAYGPTESTVGVSSYLIEEIDEKDGSVPIGRPIDNVSIYILDDGLNILPYGIVGEIYLGGIGLARGYIHNPQKTAEVFIPNPFSNNGERLYKTGDLGKLKKDGTIEYIGRADSQIKIRGYRIELGEIESTLRKISGIKDAVVDIREKSQNRILVGYLKIDKRKSFDFEKVKIELKKYLPDYMIPNILVEINEIPKSLSGKIDRSSLPDFENNLVITKNEFVEAKNKTEKKLLTIWKNLLGIEKISTTDNFFEIGGHSLLAIQLLGKISAEFDVELEMVQLFQEPTIVSLSSEILRQSSEVEDTSKIIVKFNEVEGTNPIFFIHPSGGSVHWYTLLSREFSNINSFYGIQALGINGKIEPQTSIEEMAATYIKAIKNVKQKGPYIIGSWSMGVIIAYEVAYQLSKMGEIVKPLIILDQGPVLPNNEPEDTAEFLSRMFMGRIQFSLDDLRKMSYDDQLKTVLKKAKKERQFPKYITFKKFKTYVKILKVQQDAWRNYKIPKYSGDLTLIKSKDSNYDYYDTSEYGWENFVTGNINLFITEGDHNTMLHNPKVEKLAEVIKQVLKNN